VTITALSPSDHTITMALKNIGKLIPSVGDLQTQIPSRSPNHASVVLWVEAGSLRALLGADLEHTGNAGEGWMAVLECHKGRQDQQSAALFKVPHHGSANADYPVVWSDMLNDHPFAVVTPYSALRTPLPRPSDLARLSKRTANLFCTAEGAGKPPARASVVEKTMRRELTSRRVIEGKPGHVRVRWSLNGQPPQPVVEVFHGAYQV
jgi:hypothetical protein